MRWVVLALTTVTMAFSSSQLKAQRFEVSAFVGGTFLVGDTKGLDVKAGTNNHGWNVAGGLSLEWIKSVVEHFMEPDESVHRFDGLPYIEGSAYRIVAVGLSPCTLSNGRLFWRPEGIFSLSLPIGLGPNADLVPRLQMMTSLQVITLPRIFLGVGVSFAM
jgi:hypothetical protein